MSKKLKFMYCMTKLIEKIREIYQFLEFGDHSGGNFKKW